jgi:hypothetical protein
MAGKKFNLLDMKMVDFHAVFTMRFLIVFLFFHPSSLLYPNLQIYIMALSRQKREREKNSEENKLIRLIYPIHLNLLKTPTYI